MKRTRKVYVDIDLSMKAHPVTGDIIKVTDERAVEQSIKTLVLTNFYERPFQHYLGSNARGYLFEPVSPIIEDALTKDIRDVIQKHEPRGEIVSINVNYNEDQNAYDVVIYFRVLGLDTPVKISFILERVR